MKRGELLYRSTYVYFYRRFNKHPFRYRIDPVPGVSRQRWHFSSFYKTPRTYQERRLSYAYEGYVRGRRKAANLPNPWDDWPRADVRIKRSWKKIKCRKQWGKHEK